jgi:hypothetical protein
MEFSPFEEFPLHFLSGFQSDGGGQGEREVDIEPGILAAGADGLDADGKGGRHCVGGSFNKWWLYYC